MHIYIKKQLFPLTCQTLHTNLQAKLAIYHYDETIVGNNKQFRPDVLLLLHIRLFSFYSKQLTQELKRKYQVLALNDKRELYHQNKALDAQKGYIYPKVGAALHKFDCPYIYYTDNSRLL